MFRSQRHQTVKRQRSKPKHHTPFLRWNGWVWADCWLVGEASLPTEPIVCWVFLWDFFFWVEPTEITYIFCPFLKHLNLVWRSLGNAHMCVVLFWQRLTGCACPCAAWSEEQKGLQIWEMAKDWGDLYRAPYLQGKEGRSLSPRE